MFAKIICMEKTIKKNIAYNLILTLSNFLFPLISFSYVSRVLTPTGTGKVAFVQSILAYFVIFSDFGITAYGRREVAKYRNDKQKLSLLVEELLLINFIIMIISYFLLTICVCVVGKFREYETIFVAMGSTIFFSVFGVEWFYQGIEEYRYITIRSLICKVLTVIMIILLVKDSEDIEIYGFLSILATSMSYVSNFINLRRYIDIYPIKQLRICRHLKSLLLLIAASAAATIYGNFDISMIGIMSTDKEVGLYNATIKIRNIVMAFAGATTTTLIPRMSYYIGQNMHSEVKKLVAKSMKISLYMGVPIAVFVFVYSENVLRILCGDEYIEAALMLRYVMVCVLPLIFTNLFGNQILIPYGKEKIFTQSVFIGLFINLFLNILLIPQWGAVGATWGTLVTEVWNALWMARGCKESICGLKKLAYYKFLIALCLAFFCSKIVFRVELEYEIIVLFMSGFSFILSYYFWLLIFREKEIYGFIRKRVRKIIHRYIL